MMTSARTGATTISASTKVVTRVNHIGDSLSKDRHDIDRDGPQVRIQHRQIIRIMGICPTNTAGERGCIMARTKCWRGHYLFRRRGTSTSSHPGSDIVMSATSLPRAGPPSVRDASADGHALHGLER